MTRAAWTVVVVLMAAGCATQPAPAPIAPVPPPAAAPAPPPPPPDSCGAAALQSLVGRPRTEIPVPVWPDRQRVACTTCPVTQDFDARRLNFFFDAGTGRIAEIRCG